VEGGEEWGWGGDEREREWKRKGWEEGGKERGEEERRREEREGGTLTQ